jgi:hypothetical protein
MSCLRFSTTIASSCRSEQPGVVTAYLANYSDLVSYTLSTAGSLVTGMTFSGATGTDKSFYRISFNKQVASALDTPEISIPNGTSISKPKISGFVQGMTEDVYTMYKSLLQADVICVFKTIDTKYYAVGLQNGLSMIAGSYGTVAESNGRKGLTFELEGLESLPMVELDPSDGGLASTFIINYVV